MFHAPTRKNLANSQSSLVFKDSRADILWTFGFGAPATAGVLFASGAAALIYQLLWIKQLSLVVGVDVYAVTIAVSAFFAGLAAGGALFGRLADGMVRPLRLYVLLELVWAS